MANSESRFVLKVSATQMLPSEFSPINTWAKSRPLPTALKVLKPRRAGAECRGRRTALEALQRSGMSGRRSGSWPSTAPPSSTSASSSFLATLSIKMSSLGKRERSRGHENSLLHGVSVAGSHWNLNLNLFFEQIGLSIFTVKQFVQLYRQWRVLASAFLTKLKHHSGIWFV